MDISQQFILEIKNSCYSLFRLSYVWFVTTEERTAFQSKSQLFSKILPPEIFLKPV